MTFLQLEDDAHGCENVFFEIMFSVLQQGNPIGERLAKLAVDKGMFLMACDQCAYEREIDGKLLMVR